MDIESVYLTWRYECNIVLVVAFILCIREVETQ